MTHKVPQDKLYNVHQLTQTNPELLFILVRHKAESAGFFQSSPAESMKFHIILSITWFQDSRSIYLHSSGITIQLISRKTRNRIKTQKMSKFKNLVCKSPSFFAYAFKRKTSFKKLVKKFYSSEFLVKFWFEINQHVMRLIITKMNVSDNYWMQSGGSLKF